MCRVTRGGMHRNTLCKMGQPIFSKVSDVTIKKTLQNISHFYVGRRNNFGKKMYDIQLKVHNKLVF